MRELWRKICLYVIYIGVGLVLLSPILVDNRFFFPFITTKVFLFRIVVEIVLLAFLFLNFVSDEYRPQWTWLFVFLTGFIGAAIFSSLLGGNWSLSFWGDIERGEGLILWLHLLAFFVILTSVVKTKSAWAGLLDFSLGASLLLGAFGLGQVLRVESLLATSGTRVDATLGNPAFFATYLLIHIAIALFLFALRKGAPARIYYAAVILFYTVLIFTTQTRGAVVGLAFGILIGAVLLFWTNRENKKLRGLGLGLMIALILGGGMLWMFRESRVVQNSFLRRVATISIKNRTAQTRLATWAAAWDGWKEKFVLGRGFENFDVVFNKNFPIIIYEDEGSQVWFDRAHNVIFDRGVTTGAVGLALFLAFLLYPSYHFVRRGLREPGEARNVAVIAIGFASAYLIQDLFIFETVAIYMALFFVWAFLASQYLPRLHPLQADFGGQAQRVALILTILYAATLPFVLWRVNLRPLLANAATVKVLQLAQNKDSDFFAISEDIKKILSADTYGTQEYRLQFIEWVDGKLAGVGEVVAEVRPVLEYFDSEAQRQVEEAPESAKNLLLVMRHYNYTFAVYADRHIERLNKALSFYPKLAQLSPTRPQVYQEAGYSHLYLYREYKNLGEDEKAEAQLRLAEELFRKTIELNPRVVESYINLLMLFLNSGEDQKIRDIISLMDERGVDFRTSAHLGRLSNLAQSNSQPSWYGYFNAELVKIDPNNVESLIKLAVSYALAGDRAKAFEIAEKIKEFGGEYVQQANLFIESVKRGEYEKSPN